LLKINKKKRNWTN